MENTIKTIGVESEELIQQRLKEERNTEEETYNQLLEYKKNKTILWAEVYSSEIDTRLGIVGILALWNGFRICIPDKMYFLDSYQFSLDYKTLKPEEKVVVRQRFASYQIGAHVCFTITAIDRKPKESGEGYIYGVIGNRIEALNILQDIYFKHKKYNVGKPVDIQVGDLAEAHVLSVSSRYAVVETLGIETRIDAFNLSNEYVDDCHEIVKPGDTLKVRIRKLHINEGNEPTYLTVSARLNKTPDAISGMKIGSTYLGVVNKFNKETSVYTVRLKNGVNASVFENNVMNHQKLFSGDSVIVLVTEIEKEYVKGSVMKIY